jgi:hypothetical protein
MTPNDHDAPLIRLLSIKENPLVVQMTSEELTDLVKKLRQPHSSNPKPPKPLSKAAQYKALLDSI